MKKLYCVIYGEYRKFKKHKIPLFAVSARKKMKNYLKKKKQLRY